MRQAGEPVDGVDLVDQPLIGNSRRVGPEKAEFKIFAGVEGLVGAIEQIALPVGVLFLEQGHHVGTAPAARLVHVPAHFNHNDVAEGAGLDVIGSPLIGRSGAPLGADLDDPAGLLDGGEKLAGVGHGVSGGLFHVGVAARLHGLRAHERMLEVGSGNEDCVHIFARV